MKPNITGDKTSLIRPYSLGVAAANLVFGQKELEVVPLEDLSQLDGEISDLHVDLVSSGVDSEGNVYSTSQKVANSIKATWLPLDTARAFPGLIRRGERVMIWRVGDTDKYYWTEWISEGKIRRRDVYTILVPNSGKEGEDSYTPDTAYFVEINTVDKHITVQTNKNDGEAFAYMFQINPGGGNATLCDDVGNYFQLDSKAKKISFKNQMNSEVWIEKTKGGMTTTDEITFKSKHILIDASVGIDLKTKVMSTNATVVKTVAQNVNLKASSATYTVANYSILGAVVTHNGLNIGSTHTHLFGGTPTSPPVP